ncbi:MAG: hypothetical protein AYL28_003150 [Candidatus Bathyarchaeota archaeon B23]|nr:MAG: hypothetical protein AYL28_003150 [Candidatus Bathyarchaeota archaeon B23]
MGLSVIEMLRQVLEIYELLDGPDASGESVEELLRSRGLEEIEVQRIEGERGETDFVKIRIAGMEGKTSGGAAPTLGVIGRLGGVGARPELIGIVSDADGAITALSVALKLADMARRGERLRGDVIVSTHICPKAPIWPHRPVPFMGSPIGISRMLSLEVDGEMDAILSIDATKANRVVKWRGFAITPTVKEGWILKVSDDLLGVMERVTGRIPRVCPITTQDITPYGNELDHINSMLQPSTVTTAPVVGVALTTEVPVAGCATGANHVIDLDEAARFALEVAKDYGRGLCRFYDEEEWAIIIKRYGPLKLLQTLGRGVA